MENNLLITKNVSAYFGDKQIVKDVNVNFKTNQVVAIMGPSGCGKTTFLRCLNRMHELVPSASTTGEILMHDQDINSLPPILVRSKIGMVFQQPNPFPNMSIYDNVIAGYKLNGIKLSKEDKDKIVHDSLKKAALFDEVKDKLNDKGSFLSGGQQQRLCIARAIALKPEVILMDEPTSALDPKSTSQIEDLMQSLKKNYTVIVVTHNMQQARRISDYSAFFFLGELVEYGLSKEVFQNPKDERTQNYIDGVFS